MNELVAALLLTLGTFVWVPYHDHATATWYGEEFIGRRHAASWHDETPVGWPEVATEEHFGIAAPPDVPFGTVMRLTFVDTCASGCSEEAQEMVGTQVVVVVLDRLRDQEEHRVDLMPAVASELGFGPEYGDDDWGCIYVEIEIAWSVEDLYDCPYRGFN